LAKKRRKEEEEGEEGTEQKEVQAAVPPPASPARKSLKLGGTRIAKVKSKGKARATVPWLPPN
jgi:hypothetical protein